MYRPVLLILAIITIFTAYENLAVSATEGDLITVGDIPPTPGETPEETLDNCLEWYMKAHPVPYVKDHDQCYEIIGYWGQLTWTAVEGMPDQEPGRAYNITGTIGDTGGERTIYCATFELNSIYSSQPADYILIIEGFGKCVEPDLTLEPEKDRIDVGEKTDIVVKLLCSGESVIYHFVELEVQSGPGELELEPLDDSLIAMLGTYSTMADKVVKTESGSGTGHATLIATGAGVIELIARYHACFDGHHWTEVSETAEVRAGKWVSIDCVWESDPDRFGDDYLRFGGEIHGEIQLETVEEEVYGYKVQRLSGSGQGTQTCWVECSPEEYIENKQCPDFEIEVTSGMVAGEFYNFGLTVPDSAALTYDIVYNDGDSRLSCRELEPIWHMETPITLESDPDIIFELTDTDILNGEYIITAKWMD